MWLGGKSRWQILSSVLLALTGIWFLGFILIVNTNIPTIAIFLLGIRSFINFWDTKKSVFMFLSVISIAISTSMRSQLFYISLVIIDSILIIIIFKYIKKQKLNTSLKFLLILLAASTIISPSTNEYLEFRNKNVTDSILYKRTTFYTGLLETPSYGAS